MLRHFLLFFFTCTSATMGLLGKVATDTMTVHQLLDKAYDLEDLQPDSAYRCAENALKIARKIDFERGIAQAYVRLGSILSTKGNNEKSIHFFLTALRIREKLKDYSGAANVSIATSNAYISLGKIDSVFSYLFLALKWNKLSKDSLAMAETYIALGNACEQYGDAKLGLAHYQQAESIYRSKNNLEGLQQSYSGLGYHYFKAGQTATALSYFLKAEELLSTMNLALDRARNLNNIATCYENLKNYPKAKEIYFKTLAEYQKLGMQPDVGLCLSNIGNLFLNQNQADSAIYYLSKSLAISRSVNDLKMLATSLKLISKAYYLKGNYKVAFDYLAAFSNLNDSLLDKEKIASISEMQTKYETDKKEQHIVLLNAQGKAKAAQRNIFIVGTVLFLLLTIAILIGLIKTRKEKKISEALLLNILPSEVAEELKKKGSADAQFFDEVTVLFTDIKNFTQITERLTPSELVDLLHTCFKAFDDIISKHRIEKIKTIGDSYMCAGGLPVPNKSNATDVVQAGLDIQEFLAKLMVERIKEGKEPIEMRLGIHTGPVVAGIVGIKKFAYDIWGDTVNTASRMENSGEPGKVNISEGTYQRIKDDFICTPRGMVNAKNKGMVAMYFVEGRKK